jgi:hypothetical protein
MGPVLFEKGCTQMNTINPQKFYRLLEIIGDKSQDPPLQGLIPVSRSTWYQGIREGFFPEPVKISERIAAWRGQDLLQLVSELGYESEKIYIPEQDSIATLAKWLWKLAPWNVAFTITTRPDKYGQFPSERAFRNTLTYLLKRLNVDLFGHRANRLGHRVGSAMAVEKNSDTGFHAHGVLTIPDNFNFSDFQNIFLTKIHRMKMLGNQTDIRQNPDEGWLSYMLKTGPSSLIHETLYKPFEHH